MAMFTAMSLLDASTQVWLNPWEISKAGIVIQNMQKEGRFSSSDINAVCRGLFLQRPDDVAATWQVLGPKDYADPKAGMDARELRQVLPMLGEDVAPREIKALFDRVVNSDRIDPRCARLHLRLRVVNTRLIIGELARQMQGWQAPMQPQMIAGKAHQHSAHAKIQPTGGNQ